MRYTIPDLDRLNTINFLDLEEIVEASCKLGRIDYHKQVKHKYCLEYIFLNSIYNSIVVDYDRLEYKNCKSCCESWRKSIKQFGYSNIFTVHIKDNRVYIVRRLTTDKY